MNGATDALAMIGTKVSMARLTMDPMAPEELSTCSMAGEIFSKKKDSACSGQFRFFLCNPLNFGQGFFNTLYRFIRLPTKSVISKTRCELPFMSRHVDLT
jgi:hypothetical protein